MKNRLIRSYIENADNSMNKNESELELLQDVQQVKMEPEANVSRLGMLLRSKKSKDASKRKTNMLLRTRKNQNMLLRTRKSQNMLLRTRKNQNMLLRTRKNQNMLLRSRKSQNSGLDSSKQNLKKIIWASLALRN